MQTDKLDFLFQALIKASRLESGAICLEKKDGLVYDTLAQPGVGIGLYLTREIIMRQGGYVKVVSEIGRGSTFSVFMPRR